MLGSAPIGATAIASKQVHAATTGPNTYVYSGTGGIQTGGTATLSKAKAYLPSGGLTFAGAATTSFVGVSGGVYTGRGGLKFAGSAKTSAYICTPHVIPGGWVKEILPPSPWVPSAP